MTFHKSFGGGMRGSVEGSGEVKWCVGSGSIYRVRGTGGKW